MSFWIKQQVPRKGQGMRTAEHMKAHYVRHEIAPVVDCGTEISHDQDWNICGAMYRDFIPAFPLFWGQAQPSV